MEFNPNNGVVKLCIQGMAMEDQGNAEDASRLFGQAWNEASNDLEKYLAAYYVARHQANVGERLSWLRRSLLFALESDNAAIASGLPALYLEIAGSYEELGDFANANENLERANSFPTDPVDDGPFYHGTRADLQIGDLLTPGGNSNYQAGLVMNHIYFTAVANGAGLVAALAQGDGPERIYIVEPTGGFENDPNVTNKKFPGNPTRSYRSNEPLKIVGELTNWARQTPEDIQKWRTKLAGSKGEIIN